MRTIAQLCFLFALTLGANATTLLKLSLDDLVQKSTMIVRGTIQGSSYTQRGNLIYTVYQLKATVSVYLPGGTLNGYRQSFASTPSLNTGSEYVIFLWTSPGGINQVIGLGQGVFDVKLSSTGDTILSRGSLNAEVVDFMGNKVTDQGMKLTMQRLKDTAARVGVK